MKSREKESSMKDAPQSTRRNWQLMILLEQVPEFQKDVQALRRANGIPIHGMVTDHERNPLRYEYDRAIEETVNREADEKLNKLGIFSVRPMAFGEVTDGSTFQCEIFRIGDKFQLPYNLYAHSFFGVSWYVLRNRVSVQTQNWVIDTDVINTARSLPMRWASIRAFLPLDAVEAKEAIAELNTTLREQMPKGLVKPKRPHEDTERHLFEVVEMLNTNNDEAGDRIAKTDRERLLLDRADDLALELFGYSIRSDNSDKR